MCALADAGDLTSAYTGSAAQIEPEYERLRAIPDDARIAEYYIDPAAVTTPTWLWYGGNDEVFAAVRP